MPQITGDDVMRKHPGPHLTLGHASIYVGVTQVISGTSQVPSRLNMAYVVVPRIIFGAQTLGIDDEGHTTGNWLEPIGVEQCSALSDQLKRTPVLKRVKA